MNRYLVIFSLFASLSIHGSAQEKVSFMAEDSLKLTADLYLKDFKLPFIVLFHQAESSRGEFSDIAPRLQKLNYNCLAVDLRVGNKANYKTNETAALARTVKADQNFLAAEKDIDAALRYISKFNTSPPVLVGSSYSASLCLMEASKRKNEIKAVVAMSPGEYFRPDVVVKEKIDGIDLPLFISATANEEHYIRQMVSGINQENIRFFVASEGKGLHGAKMLWSSSESSDECWLELLLFFKNLQY